jgi:hypothetical protein
VLAAAGDFGDLDGDGFPDFHLGTGYASHESLIPDATHWNRGGAGFADVTSSGGFGLLLSGRAISFADLDNDGDPELIEQVGGELPGDAYGPCVWENPGFGNHWLKVSLVGRRSNRRGVGARLRLEVVEDGRRRTIHRVAGSGAGPSRQEIGVGRAERIESLEVHWPASDETQRFAAVGVDRWIEITEGRADYRELPLRSFRLGRVGRRGRRPGRRRRCQNRDDRSWPSRCSRAWRVARRPRGVRSRNPICSRYGS